VSRRAGNFGMPELNFSDFLTWSSLGDLMISCGPGRKGAPLPKKTLSLHQYFGIFYIFGQIRYAISVY